MGPRKAERKSTSKSKPAEPRVQIWIPVIVAVISLLGVVFNSPNLVRFLERTPTPPVVQHIESNVLAPIESDPASPCPPDMVYVSEGDFIFGALDTDKDARDHEKPFHMVYLDAFCIDRTEVSNAAYSAFMKNWEENDFPAVNLTWEQASTFCQWLGRDLPTEYQWEKAARGKDGRIYPWGNKTDLSMANVENLAFTMSAVTDFEAGVSPYGALNMAGNAAEWTKDWYEADWYATIPDFGKNPSGPLEAGETGTVVVRGGSMGEVWANARTTARLETVKPNETRDYLGFRCVGSPQK